MTKARKPKPDTANELKIVRRPGESDGVVWARSTMEPDARHALLARGYGNAMFGTADVASLTDYAAHMTGVADRAAAGDIAFASRMLGAQAVTLDTMFTELARRSSANMGVHLDAAERYARLALKAQTNSRATIETLAKLHQPREQTVRHVHVNEGGQAIVADQFHHHAGGAGNAESVNQSHATGRAGGFAALPGPDAGRDALPIASSEGAQPVPDARRDKSWRTCRQPQRVEAWGAVYRGAPS